MHPLFLALFPELAGARSCRVNLEREARRWMSRHPASPAGAPGNPLLDPAVCREMLDDFHRRRGVDWSWGGYLENRRHLWRDSYLERTGNFLHLGLDIHVPQGTRVAAPRCHRVLFVEADPDRDGGWGTRIIAALDEAPVLLLYAHLQRPAVEPAAEIPAGALLAEVGGPPENGNWSPHLHLQAIDRTYFETVLLDHFEEMDGYGPPSQQRELRRLFPDPLPYVVPAD